MTTEDTSTMTAGGSPLGRGVRPCDLPCEKCGSDDLYRRFVANAQRMDNKKYGKPPSRYSRGHGHAYYATRDHLTHVCRCCGYQWQTLPMSKPRKSAAAGVTA